MDRKGAWGGQQCPRGQCLVCHAHDLVLAADSDVLAPRLEAPAVALATRAFDWEIRKNIALRRSFQMFFTEKTVTLLFILFNLFIYLFIARGFVCLLETETERDRRRESIFRGVW